MGKLKTTSVRSEMIVPYELEDVPESYTVTLNNILLDYLGGYFLSCGCILKMLSLFF